MYEVIHQFMDLQDGNYVYHVGEKFPRNGSKASAERLEELSGSENRMRIPLIKKKEVQKKRTRKKKTE